MKMWKFTLLVILAAVLAFSFTLGCDDDDDDDDDAAADDDDSADDDDAVDDDDVVGDDDDDVVDDDDDIDYGDWFPPAEGTSMVYEAEEWQGGTFDLEMEVMGEETYAGATYTMIQLGDFTQDDIIGFQGYFDFSTEGQIGFGGAEIFWENTAKGDTEPEGVFVLTDPVKIFLNPNLDSPLSDSGSGTWTIWGDESTFDITLTSTTLALNETVTVPYGTVENCMKVQVDIVEQFSLWPEFTDTALFWFHTDLGMVKLDGSRLMGFYLELKSIAQ